MNVEEQTIKDLFEKLDSNNKLALKKNDEFSVEFSKMKERVKQSGIVFAKYRKLFEDPIKLAEYVKMNSGFGLNENDVLKIFGNFMTQYSLDYIEVTKKFFLENLDQNSTLNGKQISKINTLGDLVRRLNTEFNLPQLLVMFPYEFRNILGHGSYWWNVHEHFCYIDDDGIEIELQFGEFMDLIQIFDKTHLFIWREYITRV